MILVLEAALDLQEILGSPEHKEARVQLVLPDLLVILVQLALEVILELQDSQGCLVMLGLLERLVHQEDQGLQEHEEILVYKEQQEQLEQVAHLGSQVHLVILEQRVILVYKAHQDQEEM